MWNVCELVLFQIKFENLGAEDIVDGNPRLILGLIWTIILRFHIQDIVIDVVSSGHLFNMTYMYCIKVFWSVYEQIKASQFYQSTRHKGSDPIQYFWSYTKNEREIYFGSIIMCKKLIEIFLKCPFCGRFSMWSLPVNHVSMSFPRVLALA